MIYNVYVQNLYKKDESERESERLYQRRRKKEKRKRQKLTKVYTHAPTDHL